ncbi:SAV_915 family protein [Kitasatospora camelliae]|uniref:SAV_915 family protein n=1 Tax=Kitasatospora camelliae TaxID=3156397 RepID=A0AAU8JPZ1_9ACTN
MTTENDMADDRPRFHVPVRTVGAVQVLRLFRHRDGSRCAVAFSTAEALRALLDADQESAVVGEPALRELTGPLGIGRLVLDPALVAPPVTAPAPPAAACERQLVPGR